VLICREGSVYAISTIILPLGQDGRSHPSPSSGDEGADYEAASVLLERIRA
jgi:hypothetical protein